MAEITKIHDFATENIISNFPINWQRNKLVIPEILVVISLEKYPFIWVAGDSLVK